MSADTKEALLDAAESLLLERGFAGTSLRSIAEKADVNLAATNYHFGSKQGLLEALVHRRVRPINEARLENLGRLEATGETLEVEEILFAFLEPLSEGTTMNLAALIERIFKEPPAVTKALLEKEFGEVIARFAAALAKVVPELSHDELHWRLHFLVGGMLQTLKMENPIGSSGNADFCKYQQLIRFASAGFRAAPS